MKVVYLAGPEVLSPGYDTVIAQKTALVRDRGLIPVHPGVLPYPTFGGRTPPGEAISAINEMLMRGADAIIANLTPFRGLSADPGTIYELGFMAALDKPVFGYTDEPRRHYDRLADHFGGAIRTDEHGEVRGPDGTLVETFGMVDNVMIDAGIARRGGVVIVAGEADAPDGDPLSPFRACLGAAAAFLAPNGGS